MASPFRVFRKHQKILIATLCLMAIIAFVFLGIVQQLQGMRSHTDEVVVTTNKYGDLTAQQINNMIACRQATARFLRAALQQYGAGPSTEAAYMQLNAVMYDLESGGEIATVDTWLKCQRAAEQGLKINDDVVTNFLREATSHRVSNQQFAALYKQLNISENLVYDTLRDALLGMYYGDILSYGSRVTTPAESWEYFQRLKRSVDAEVVPVAVADFIDQVPDPSEKELKTFFEEHKNVFHVRGRPEPGFRVPEKVAAEYLVAELAEFSSPVAVTEEEIKQYYENNREEFAKLILPGAAEDEEGNEDEKDKKDGKAAQTSSDEPTAKTTDDSKKPAAPTTETAPKDKGSEEKAPEKKTFEQKPQATPKDNASAPWKGVTVRLVADEKQSAGESKEAEKEPKTANTDETGQKKETGTKESSAPAPQAPALPVFPKSDAKSADSATPPSDAPTQPEPPISIKKEYKTLDEVRSQIRRKLADAKAVERIDKAFDAVSEKLKKFRLANIHHQARDKKSAPPEIDIKALAKEHGLSFYQIGLVDRVTLSETELGKSVKVDSNLGDLGIGVTEDLFKRLNKYQTDRSHDGLGTKYYLFWKTQEEKEHIPEFEDVRDEVLSAWKEVQARSLARARAEALAAEASKVNRPLRSSLIGKSGVKVAQTGEFTWLRLQPGQYGNDVVSSSAPKVEWAGEEFMRTVYGLEVGQVGVAMNQPESIAYVIRLTATAPTEKVLWAEFIRSDALRNQVANAVNRSQLRQVWSEELQKETGLEWKRPPHIEQDR
ncbi:MAG: hypothetical protein JW818_09325 [Pirellulales bacterium]|nr:hypothetical protein [Pirellulales bacterium]